jgi:glycerol kinase
MDIHMAPSATASEPTRGVVLAIDQGTTNTKAALVSTERDVVIALASRPVGIRHPRPGWAEQDAEEIWAATTASIDQCLAAATDVEVRAVAISSQRESVVCWSRSTGEPLGPVLGWQDGRTADWCEELSASHPDAPEIVRARTGLTLDPMFSAPKMRLAFESATQRGHRPGDVMVGTMDSWLVWRLTGELMTEVGNASRTLLLDIRSLRWDSELLELFGIPESALPHVQSSDAGFGVTRGVGRLRPGVPVSAVLADSHAALYAHGCLKPGTGKATYGTGTSVMAITGKPAEEVAGVTTTVAWQIDGHVAHAREGNILATGSALDWMATTLGIAEGSGGAALTELSSGVADSDGVTFVPAFSGLGAPYWDRRAVGIVAGVTAGTSRAHLARAAIECVAHQVADVIEAIESGSDPQIDALHVGGGAAASSVLLQAQADILGRPLLVGTESQASILGVARLAAGARPSSAPEHTHVVPRVGFDRLTARDQWGIAVSRARARMVAGEPHGQRISSLGEVSDV